MSRLFTSRAVVDYNGDDSVTIDVRRALDDKFQAGVRADVATSGRFESRWIVHATLTDAVVAEGSQRQCLYLERSGFCGEFQVPW